MNDNREHGVIFFDGICNLCNYTVRFIILNDQKDYFRFAALQSEVAKREFVKLNLQDPTASTIDGLNQEQLSTIVLLEGGKAYYRSTAALRIARRLGGFWSLWYGFIIIPSFIRDFFYLLISKNRYRIWGKQESCMVPSAALESKFL